MIFKFYVKINSIYIDHLCWISKYIFSFILWDNFWLCDNRMSKGLKVSLLSKKKKGLKVSLKQKFPHDTWIKLKI